MPMTANSAAEDIAAWLANSLNRPADAREQWAEGRAALLALGREFSAVRLTEALVHAVASADLAAASAALRSLDGPVIHDPRNQRFYALVPSSPPGPSLGAHAERLGLGSYIGVPRVGNNEQNDAWSSYWIVPMSAPGRLCNPSRVNSLINAGMKLLATKAVDS